MSIYVLLGFNNLYQVAFQGAGGHYDHSGDFYDYSFVACSSDFDECAFQAVELASVNAYLYSFVEVYFVRGEEEQAVAECLGDLHEAFHLLV